MFKVQTVSYKYLSLLQPEKKKDLYSKLPRHSKYPRFTVPFSHEKHLKFIYFIYELLILF